MFQSFLAWESKEVSFGAGLAFIAMLTFMMALFFPVMRKIIMGLLSCTNFYSLQKISYDRGPDWKCASLLEKEATRNKDDFLIDRIAEHNLSTKEKEIDLNIAFSLSMLFVINCFLIGRTDLVSFTQNIHLLMSEDFGFFIEKIIDAGVAVFTIFIVFMGWQSIAYLEGDQIYWPDVKADEEKSSSADGFSDR